jgi:uncharacterized membrane protein YagU involved in acid resistance
MRRVVYGAVAGVAGTALMTIAMHWLWRRLPENERYPLPPREIIERTLPGAVDRHAGEQTRREMTLAAHFAFGAAAGVPFAVGTRSRSPAAGALYGVVVWAASYLGWVPAMRILKPASEHPTRRNLLMIGVHLIWGASMALALRRVERAEMAPFRRSDPDP